MTTFKVSDKITEKVEHKYKLNILDEINQKAKVSYTELIASSINTNDISDQIYSSDFENGFVGSVFKSYNKHHNLIVRPDDVWIGVLVQFSRYINSNSEELRDRFVNFEGKKTLTVSLDGDLRSNSYDIFVKSMTERISENIVDPSLLNIIVPNFSTTTELDKIACSIIMMSTMQNYFTYIGGCMCGIPSVTILGTIDDWEQLRTNVNSLIKYDNSSKLISKWLTMLDPILENFVLSIGGSPNIKWWSQIIDYHSGSGLSIISGWLSVFCVFGIDGKWFGDDFEMDLPKLKSEWPIVSTDDIGPGFASVPIKIVCGDITHSVEMMGGHIGYYLLNDDTTIQPSVGWFVLLVGDGEIETLQDDYQ